MVIGTMKNLNQMKKRRQAQLLSNGTPQLTIQPIKRVERTQPVRVQEEPIHDTSNSKMFIILAVGAMVGFLIATIIWK
jgi:hypothetical protein